MWEVRVKTPPERILGCNWPTKDVRCSKYSPFVVWWKTRSMRRGVKSSKVYGNQKKNMQEEVVMLPSFSQFSWILNRKIKKKLPFMDVLLEGFRDLGGSGGGARGWGHRGTRAPKSLSKWKMLDTSHLLKAPRCLFLKKPVYVEWKTSAKSPQQTQQSMEKT